MTSIPERIAFLRKIHLFAELSEDDLNDIVQALIDEEYQTGDQIIAQGAVGETMYLLFRGQAKVVRRRDSREEVLAHLVSQDYFGEEELFGDRPRTASVVATTTLLALALSREKMAELFKRTPALKQTLDVVINSHRLWRKLRFKWVRADEDVYFVSRKHVIRLWITLVWPLAALILPLGAALWGVLVNAIWPIGIAVMFTVLIAGWIAWLVLDHENDFYVVTSQRVIWVEKVIGIFDSRTEAPLGTVLSVSVETDYLGRMLDYGNVIIRTYVGKIAFNTVGRPHLAARIIEEYWGRTKEENLALEKEAMKDAIRKRLGIPVAPRPAAPAAEETKASQIRRPSALRIALSHIFTLRLEDGDTITYRKHGFVLFQQIWLPSIVLLSLIGWWFLRLIYLLGHPDEVLFGFQQGIGLQIDSILMSLPAIMIPFLLWWIYQYWDWTNDIFQVTPDQIIDVDKTPFGTEERRASPLENILSTESQRVGLLGNIFNFGTVYITVGGAKLEFQDVFDPTTVQSDIDRRRSARQADKAAAAAIGERERMAEWIATYHLNSDDFLGEQGKNKENPE